MSDMKIAHIGRELAHSLMRFAKERDSQSKKDLAELHTRLCHAVRAEAADDAAEAATHELQL